VIITDIYYLETPSIPQTSTRFLQQWQHESFQERSAKRQRTRDSSRIQVPRKAFSKVVDAPMVLGGGCDAESVISSECCSSCSSGVLCDEPDCEAQKVVVIPCDKQSCDEFICHCPEPGEFAVSQDFQSGNLENCRSCLPTALPKQVQRDLSVPRKVHTRQGSTLSNVSQPHSIVTSPLSNDMKQPPLPSQKPIADDRRLSNNNNRQSTTMVSGIGSHFEDNSTSWPRPDTFNTIFNCGWSECNEPFYSEEELGSHVHQKHVDPQLLIRCPGPACKEKMSPEPLQSHLELSHGFNFDDRNTCPAPNCLPETLLNPIDYHNHLHKAHTDPAAPPLQCGWASCGDQFLDEFQFWNHLPDQ